MSLAKESDVDWVSPLKASSTYAAGMRAARSGRKASIRAELEDIEGCCSFCGKAPLYYSLTCRNTPQEGDRCVEEKNETNTRGCRGVSSAATGRSKPKNCKRRTSSVWVWQTRNEKLPGGSRFKSYHACRISQFMQGG
jgi:hypothetical protein